MGRCLVGIALVLAGLLGAVPAAPGWYDETHVAIAKAAGVPKWFNAAAADIAGAKIGRTEKYNHFVNNPRGTVVTPAIVLAQAERYDTYHPAGHLYGAIVATVRQVKAARAAGRYAGIPLAYLMHYVGDLSMPLHNTVYNGFNREHHAAMDGIVNDEVLANIDAILIHPIAIASEQDLAREVARIANISLRLAYLLEDEARLPTRRETYQQLGHSASLLKAIWRYILTETDQDGHGG